MLNVTSMQQQVIYPALNKMGMWSEAAGELVLGTAIVESNLTYLKQHGEGPALGLWQVEPATHEDLYANYLNFRPEMMSSLMELRSPPLNMNENLATNLMYGAAVYRLCYYRKPDPLPEAGDVEGQGLFGRNITTRRWAKERFQNMSSRFSKLSKKRVSKPRDPSWWLRRALGHRVELNPKA